MTERTETPRGDALNVVVVSYGPAALLERALSALGDGYTTIIIDNSSSAEAKDIAQRAGAHYVDPGHNLGFARAVNVALGQRHPPDADVLLLNPDARVSAQAVDQLHRALGARRDLACVAPAQHVPGSSTPSPVWWPWHTPGGAWAEAIGLGHMRRPEGFLSGAILLLRSEALSAVGHFDERFFLYSEEEDWQRRARDAGWHAHACADVDADHEMGGTETDLARQQLRVHVAIERYIRKWYGPAGWALYRLGTLFGYALRLVAYRGHQRKTVARLAKVYLEGPDKAGQRTGAVPAFPSDAGAH